ncbi:MAG: beta-galactosidase [Ignavibacteriales bacterium]|nr:beta-galactosidase [Ignavibacteriales bacterium]
MKYFPFLTVSILLYCSDSPLYGQLSYPVPSGVYCSCGPTLATGQGSVAPAIAAKPFVKGILVRIEWDLLEPTDNNFNWVQLDTQIARAKSYGKKVALGIVNGKGAPGWLYAIAGVQPVVYNNGADTIPLPWDTAYLRQWQELIVEAGRRYLNDTTITLVHMTNSSFNGFEFQLPPEGLVNWSLFQYTEQKIIDSWKTVITSFGAAFPHHYLDNDFHPVFLISSSSSTPADSVYTFARGKIGQRYGALAAWWTQNNVNNYPFNIRGFSTRLRKVLLPCNSPKTVQMTQPRLGREACPELYLRLSLTALVIGKYGIRIF